MIKNYKKKKPYKKWKNYPKFVPRLPKDSAQTLLKIRSRDIALSTTLNTVNASGDIGNILIGAADYISASAVFKRFKVIGAQVKIYSVLPTVLTAQTYLAMGYNPNVLSAPGAIQSVLDLETMKTLTPFQTGITKMYFKPKASVNNTITTNGITVDEDGFMPIVTNNPPFYGSLQFYQDTSATTAGIAWYYNVCFYVIVTSQG